MKKTILLLSAAFITVASASAKKESLQLKSSLISIMTCQQKKMKMHLKHLKLKEPT